MPLPKKAPHNVIAQKPRKYGRHSETFAQRAANPYFFTKTDLRRRLRQLNDPERLQWNDGVRTPVSFAIAELLREPY